MDTFEQAAKAAARQLRRMPADLRKEMARHVQENVAEPLARDVESAARTATPWGPKIAPTAKARIQGDPTIAVGAGRKVFSGGASVNQVVYGAEFGGGKSTKAVNPRGPQGPHRRRTTMQFARKSRSFIYATFRSRAEWALNRWVQVLDPYLERWEAGDG